MELKILEDSKNKMTVEFVGETNTIPDILRKELWQDQKVKISGININHPLVGSPRLTIETTGTTKPRDALNDAIKRLKKDITKISKDFLKAAK